MRKQTGIGSEYRTDRHQSKNLNNKEPLRNIRYSSKKQKSTNNSYFKSSKRNQSQDTASSSPKSTQRNSEYFEKLRDSTASLLSSQIDLLCPRKKRVEVSVRSSIIELKPVIVKNLSQKQSK